MIAGCIWNELETKTNRITTIIMTRQSLLPILFAFIIMSGCGPRKKTVYQYKPKPKVETTVVKQLDQPAVVEETPENTKPLSATERTLAYIEAYSDIAITEMNRYKIPASITIAQGILESGSGIGTLAIRANNHFGIKCHEWTGERVYHDDDSLQECFRKYDDPSGSFEDHSIFLRNRSRYSKLFDLDLKDYRGWAYGLKAAGYATDPKYPDKLISIIERYELYKLDGSENPAAPVAINPSNQKVHFVRKGDTLYSISKTYGVTVDRLKQLNQLNDDNISIGQDLVIDND